MKKFIRIGTYMLTALLAATFVSCEEDSDSPSKISGSEFTALETAGTLSLGFQLDQPTSKDIDVTIAVTGGTATEGVDFDVLESSRTIAAGETNGSFKIVLFNDLDGEGDETVVFSISAAGLSVGSYTLTISDDDCPFEFVGDLGGVDANLDKGDFAGVADVTITYEEGVYKILGLNRDFMESFWGEEIIDEVAVTIEIDAGGNITIPDQYIMTTLFEGVEYPYHIYGTGVVNTCEGNVTLDYEMDQDGFKVGAYVHTTGNWMTDEVFKAVLTPNE